MMFLVKSENKTYKRASKSKIYLSCLLHESYMSQVLNLAHKGTELSELNIN